MYHWMAYTDKLTPVSEGNREIWSKNETDISQRHVLVCKLISGICWNWLNAASMSGMFANMVLPSSFG